MGLWRGNVFRSRKVNISKEPSEPSFLDMLFELSTVSGASGTVGMAYSKHNDKLISVGSTKAYLVDVDSFTYAKDISFYALLLINGNYVVQYTNNTDNTTTITSFDYNLNQKWSVTLTPPSGYKYVTRRGIGIKDNTFYIMVGEENLSNYQWSYKIYKISANDGSIESTISSNDGVGCVGDYVYIMDGNIIHIYDLDLSQEIYSYSFPSGYTFVSYVCCGGDIFVSVSDGNNFYIYRFGSSLKWSQGPFTGYGLRINTNPNCSKIVTNYYTSQTSYKTSVFDANDGHEIKSVSTIIGIKVFIDDYGNVIIVASTYGRTVWYNNSISIVKTTDTSTSLTCQNAYAFVRGGKWYLAESNGDLYIYT